MYKVCCLLLTPPACPSSRYTVYNLAPYMRDYGVDVKVLPFYSPEAYERISQGKSLEKVVQIGLGYLKRVAHWVEASHSDAIWIQRFAVPVGTGLLASALRTLGRPLVFGYDDAVYLPRGQRSRLRSWLGSWRDINGLISMSDCVIARNSVLREHARQYNPHVVMFPSAIDVALYDRVLETTPPRRNGTSTFVVGWIGTPSSAPYLELLRPVLEELGRESPIELRVIGGDIGDLANVVVRKITWQQVTEIRELAQVDVGIAPLPDDEWARGKSGLKVVQYMGCGIPVVASAVGPHLDLVKPGVQGFLVRTEEEWLEALRILRDDRSLRLKMGMVGRQTVRSKHDFPLIARAHAEVFVRVCRKRG